MEKRDEQKAIAVGLGIGLLLEASALYSCLKTGFWDQGAFTAILLGAGILPWLLKRRAQAQELAVVQAAAVGMTLMPATMGFLGTGPAFAILGAPFEGPPLWIYGAATALFGTLLGRELAPWFVESRKLPFPSSKLFAESIRSASSSGADARRSVFLFVGALIFSGGFAAARELFPSAVPAALGAQWLEPLLGPWWALGLGLTVSLMSLATGAIIGPKMGFSMLLGALLMWWLAPALDGQGLLQGASFAEKADSLRRFYSWPSIGVLVGASVPVLWLMIQSMARLRRQQPEEGEQRASASSAEAPGKRSKAVVWAALLGLAMVSAWSLQWASGFGWAVWLLCVVAPFVLTVVIGQMAGETDMAMFGNTGQLAQVAAGAVAPGQIFANLSAASQGANAPVPASMMMYNQALAKRVGLAMPPLFRAQLWGCAVGVPFAVVLYELLTRGKILGSPEMPVAWSVEFAQLAKVLAGGLSALPPGGKEAAGIALALGLGLAVVETRWPRWMLFSVFGLGLGGILGVPVVATMALGAVVGAAILKNASEQKTQWVNAAAAGLVAGESIAGAVAGLWRASS